MLQIACHHVPVLLRNGHRVDVSVDADEGEKINVCEGMDAVAGEGIDWCDV